MRISTVIFDWAGTAVDFGCMAPVEAFVSAFRTHGLEPTPEETRAPMGMSKRAHVATMLSGKRLASQWEQVHGRPHTEADVDAIYADFEPAVLATLSDFTTPLPGVLDTVATLRKLGLNIGSTTGYTAPMMEIVAPAAAAQGYAPDVWVSAEDVGGIGRPAPYMVWRALQEVGCESISAVIKVGDTIADITEGKNAGCLAVGVAVGSSLMGLSQPEWEALTPAAQAAAVADTRARFLAAGADFVLETSCELPDLLRMIG